MDNKTLSYIGLCKKAGKLTQGSALTVEALRAGKVRLAVLSSDCSNNTEKRVSDCCSYRNIKCIKLPYTMEQLGKALGSSGNVSAAGITDEGLSLKISSSLE